MNRLFTLAGLAAISAVSVLAVAHAGPSVEIERRMEQLSLGQERSIAGVSIVARDLLPALYRDRSFEPLWTREDAIPQLQALIDYAVADGLDREDYPITELGQLQTTDPVAFDILASELLVRVAYHLRFGKVNPQALDAAWNFDRRLREGSNPPHTLQQAAMAPSLVSFASSLFPRGELYQDVRAALADYRALAAAGGWPSVTPGPVLRKGDRDPRVVQLRARLAVTDGAPTTAADPPLFDEALEKTVIAFQNRHGLEADGVAGASTYAALNVPISQRIDQLRATLERGRWIMEDLSGRFVLVNIASFEVAVVQDREFIWLSRVQVGKPYRKTPVFKGEIEYLQVNPTWTVPPTILTKDVLPAIRSDPSYLEGKNMVVLRQDGGQVDPKTIDWANMTGSFPYIIRQRPGPTNALGRVKFIFPNEYSVFLHDTPSRMLFDRSERAFSSGCIRVENPFDLAVLLMDDPASWSRAAFDELLATEETKTLYLEPKVPVYILYLTALVRRGAPHFYEDIYGRDARLLAALRQQPTIDLPQ